MEKRIKAGAVSRMTATVKGVTLGLATAMMACAGGARAEEIKADNPAAIKAAIAAAKPGDTILMKAGEYDMGQRVNVGVSGEKDKPITIRCEGDKGYAKWHTRGGNRCCYITGKHLAFIGIHFDGEGPRGCGQARPARRGTG